MELLVIVAVLLVIAAIAVPIYRYVAGKQHGKLALERMRVLAGGVRTYAMQNNDQLPSEDVAGTDSWDNAAKPDGKDAWYNSVMTVIGKKPVAEYVHSPRSFYEKDNYLFLPGADYPKDDEKLTAPLFAIAFNTKLHRKDAQDQKRRTKLSEITNQARTVVLLEQGLPGEKRTLQIQTKKDYDGAPKGSAKSFVGRDSGKGVLAFVDGHAELTEVKETLTETGDFPFPQTDFVWTPTPEEDPNKKDDGSKKGDGKK
jgi:prepilin-type processing-associated H-X9-DG protein